MADDWNLFFINLGAVHTYQRRIYQSHIAHMAFICQTRPRAL